MALNEVQITFFWVFSKNDQNLTPKMPKSAKNPVPPFFEKSDFFGPLHLEIAMEIAKKKQRFFDVFRPKKVVQKVCFFFDDFWGFSIETRE